MEIRHKGTCAELSLVLKIILLHIWLLKINNHKTTSQHLNIFLLFTQRKNKLHIVKNDMLAIL